MPTEIEDCGDIMLHMKAQGQALPPDLIMAWGKSAGGDLGSRGTENKGEINSYLPF